MENKIKEKLSNSQIERLYAYTDGELSVSERTAVEQLLSNADVRQELDSISEMKQKITQGVQVWFAEQRPLFSSEDIWNNVSARILEDSRNSFSNRVRSFVTTMQDGFSTNFRRFAMPVGATFAAAALAVVLLPPAEGPVSDGSKLALDQTVVKQGMSTPVKLESSLRVASPLLVSEGTRRNYYNRLRPFEEVPLQISRGSSANMSSMQVPMQVTSRSASPVSTASNVSALANHSSEQSLRLSELNSSQRVVRIPVRDLINRDFVLGGLRTGAADFSWVKSERKVDLLAPADAEVPPVIWLSNEKLEK